MSGTNFCKCTNENCDFTPHLSWGVPVWADHVPIEQRKVPNANRGYILETKDEKMCINCREYVFVECKTYVCPNCSKSHTLVTIGDQCPKCNQGIIEDTGIGPKF